ncbi:ATP-binding protein [Clostridium minihomine]|uniref:ATP-binding protein n=1 Tax=Clostridium minihomine TaxID=2045012 RepID=UPI000C757322|nr:ATP-binding protein [Clostridium minihomine]
MYECPIDYFTDNLIFGHDRSCWALFEIKGFDYDMLGDDSKVGILNKLTLFIANVIEAKFMIVPVMQDLDSHFSNLIKGLRPDDLLYTHAVNQANLTKAYLQQRIDSNGKSNDYKTFVAIKLQKDGETEIATQAREALDFLVKALIKDFNAFMHIDAKDIRASKVLEYKKMSQQVYAEQDKRMALIVTDIDTTQWVLRRMMYRGLHRNVQLFHKSKNESWRPYASSVTLAGTEYIRPRKRELVNLFSGVIRPSGRVLQIAHEHEISYQSFLVITNIPDNLEFPDSEWIYLLQQLNQQAEVYIHVKNQEHREALKTIEFKRRQANSQIENIESAGAEIPDDLWESKRDINDLEAELKPAKLPLSHVSITICLADSTPDGLEKKVLAVKKEYEDLNFIVERPLTDQFALFYQSIPTVGNTIKDFIMKLPPTALASGLIGATHELGSHIGPFIGTTGLERKQVFLDLREACLSNVSASTTFYGNLGVGKSFNANLLTYLHVMYGAYALIIDPKGERSHWVTDLPNCQELVTLVTLEPDKAFRGALDPWNIFRDNPEEAAELATNIVSELFKIRPRDAKYTALLEALNKIQKEQRPSMQKLADILGSFPAEDDLAKDAQLLARQIKLLRQSGMSQLLIGDGTEQAISLSNRINILQIQNLKLPSPDTKKEDYTQEENISTVLMMVISAFCRSFIHSHKNNFKIILYDESWMLGKTVEGEKLISYGARMSRSLYTSIILNGHSVTDLPNEGIRNSITYKFCFKTDNTAEAERMLDFLKMEKTPSNIQLLNSLGNAQCLFQDLNGRVGILQFDAVFQDLIDVFSTTPVDAKNLKIEQPEELIEEIKEPEEIDIFAYERTP